MVFPGWFWDKIGYGLWGKRRFLLVSRFYMRMNCLEVSISRIFFLDERGSESEDWRARIDWYKSKRNFKFQFLSLIFYFIVFDFILFYLTFTKLGKILLGWIWMQLINLPAMIEILYTDFLLGNVPFLKPVLIMCFLIYLGPWETMQIMQIIRYGAS